MIKLKRFIVKARQNWKQIFSEKEFDKKFYANVSRDISEDIMTIDIEYRLEVLKAIETKVLTKTKEKVVALEKQRLLILAKLEEYETNI